MTDPQSTPSTDDLIGPAPSEQGRPPATPRWVKISGAVLVLIVLAALVKVLVGGGVGGHGPGLHSGLGALSTAPSASAAFAPALARPSR